METFTALLYEKITPEIEKKRKNSINRRLHCNRLKVVRYLCFEHEKYRARHQNLFCLKKAQLQECLEHLKLKTLEAKLTMD